MLNCESRLENDENLHAPEEQPIYNTIEFAELNQFECYNSYGLPRWGNFQSY